MELEGKQWAKIWNAGGEYRDSLPHDLVEGEQTFQPLAGTRHAHTLWRSLGVGLLRHTLMAPGIRDEGVRCLEYDHLFSKLIRFSAFRTLR